MRSVFATAVILSLAALSSGAPARADSDEPEYVLLASLWTTHWTPQPYHNNDQRLIGLERFGSNFVTRPLEERGTLFDTADPLMGGTLFRNSFDQQSAYVYAGFRQQMTGNHHTQTYFKVTAGIIHGYRGEHRDKIPLNRFGTTVAAIPSMGIQHRRVKAEAVLFGTAGLMLNLGFTF